MNLSIDDVKKVAKLARLRLSPEEEQEFLGQLGDILGYIEMLNEVDTDKVEPMAHIADVVNIFRSDEAQPSIDRDKALSNAPKTDGTYFLVPQILDGAE